MSSCSETRDFTTAKFTEYCIVPLVSRTGYISWAHWLANNMYFVVVQEALHSGKEQIIVLHI